MPRPVRDTRGRGLAARHTRHAQSVCRPLGEPEHQDRETEADHHQLNHGALSSRSAAVGANTRVNASGSGSSLR